MSTCIWRQGSGESPDARFAWACVHFFPKVCHFFPENVHFFPDSRKCSKLFRKYHFSPLRFSFFRSFFERGQRTGLLLVKSGFGARTIFYAVRAQRCLEDTAPPRCRAGLPVSSPAKFKFQFFRRTFSEEVQNFSEATFSELPNSFKIFPQKFKIFP